tara:strand:+ start:605 stop:1678 length:1074 start_codon:yes stop_codon:yes gene_type:complete
MNFKSTFKNKKSLRLYFLFLLLLAGMIWKFSSKKNPERDISGFITIAESGSLPGQITASGQLEPEKSLTLSSKRQGIIKEIHVVVGEEVKKGQLIAKMEGGDLVYRLNEINAEYEKQKANYKRRSFLYTEGAISKEKFEDYKNLFLISEARLKQLEVERKDLLIIAPFKGIITNRFSEPGSFVTPSSSSSKSSSTINRSIVELSQGLEVIAKVPESDIGRIQIGQKALIRVDSFPEKRFQAKVNKISPKAIQDNNVISFEVSLVLLNPSSKLRLGMTADIEFQTGRTSIGTLVPTVAIVTKNGVPGLLFVGEKNQPEFRKIELGTSSGSKTTIIKGISPGEEFFIDLPPWSKDINKD